MIRQEYKETLARILETSSEKIFLYWKGRVALYALLKAMGVKEGDEVILPAFTCVVVPNAIKYLGAIPVYVDISDETYNAEISNIVNAISERTKVIICQNTFGLSSNVEDIVTIAKLKNICTIEDCSHGFGGYYNGKPNGSSCDAAFYSTQWNKPFSTGVGGFLLLNNDKLLVKIQVQERDKIKSSKFDQAILFSLINFNKYFVNKFTNDFLVGTYRFLSKKNLIIGSNQGKELSGVSMPYDYFKDISDIQIKAGIKALKKLSQLNQNRKKNATDYSNFLKLNNKKYVNENYFSNHLFLKYPLLVSNRELFNHKAAKEKIILGDWFCSPIYPVKENLGIWGFDGKKFPISMRIAKMIVNLPTDIKDNLRVLNFLERNLQLIQ